MLPQKKLPDPLTSTPDLSLDFCQDGTGKLVRREALHDEGDDEEDDDVGRRCSPLWDFLATCVRS